MKNISDIFENIAGHAEIRAYSENGTDSTAVLAGKLARHIKFRRLRTANGELFVRVYPHDEKYAEKLIAETGMRSEVVGRHGALYFLKRYSRRTGLYIGAVLAAALAAFLSNIVLKIEISGNETVTDSEIISYLSDAGVTYGSFIPSIDFRQVQRQLTSSSEKIAWAAVRRSGFRVITEISEMTLPPKIVTKNCPSNIIALYDARITSVTVYSGMLMPMLGDTVRKGEILISGIVPKKFEGTYTVRAIGEIRGQYRRTAEFFQSYEDAERSYGESFTNKYLTISGKTFSLPGNKKTDGDYEFSKSSEYVTFIGFTLPAEITRIDIYPYTEKKTVRTKEQAKEVLMEEIDIFEKNILNDDGTEITDRKLKFIPSAKGLTAEAAYIIEGNIGTEQQIYFNNEELGMRN